MVKLFTPLQESRFQKSPGSTEFQILLLTQRIFELNVHLQSHRSDYAAIRGLRRILGHRKRLLKYLHAQDSLKSKQMMQFIRHKKTPSSRIL